MQPDTNTSPFSDPPTPAGPSRVTLNPVQAGLLADLLLDGRIDLHLSAFMVAWHAGLSETTVHQLEHARNLRPRRDHVNALMAELHLDHATVNRILRPLSEDQRQAISVCLRDNAPTLTELDIDDVVELVTKLIASHEPTSGSHRTRGHRYDRR